MEKPRKKGRRPSTPRPRVTRVATRVEGARVGRRNVLLFLVGVAAIVLGFFLLSQGAESLATILLVGGYLGLIPWAILAKERPARPEEGE